MTDLPGAAFIMSIAEPWDFESDAGQNELSGRILGWTSEGPQRLLVRTDQEIVLGAESHGREFLLSVRHSGDRLEDLSLRKAIPVNCSLRSTGRFALIGLAALVTDEPSATIRQRVALHPKSAH